MPKKTKNRYLQSDEAFLRDMSRKLHPEEFKRLFGLARRRWRRRPERLKITSLKVEGETARGLKPILISHGKTDMVVHGHNPERITLGSIGNLDFYCYPNLWNDRVFIGLFPNSVRVEMVDFKKLFSLVMRTYWALKTGMQTKRIIAQERWKKKQKSFNKKSIKAQKTTEKRINGKFNAQNTAK